jgi:hypothetical protein
VRLRIPASVALFSLLAILNSSAQTSRSEATAPSTPTVIPSEGHRGRHGDRPYAIPLIYPIPLPYAVENSEPDANADDSDADYQGGPTVFDRRGAGAASYVPPVRNVPMPHAAQQAETASRAPVPPQPTLLIFKDGRKLEVGNYAIVRASLFDLTPGHQRVIALADLDLDATRRQNGRDQGEMFQSRPRAN